MNVCKLFTLLMSIVFITQTQVIADEQNGKSVSDYASTCATPNRIKTDQSYPVRACSIEVVPVGNVYLPIFENLLAPNRPGSASLNHIENRNGRPDSTVTLNANSAKSTFGGREMKTTGSVVESADDGGFLSEQLLDSLMPAAIADNAIITDETQQESGANRNQILQPIKPEEQDGLDVPEKHSYDTESLENKNVLLAPEDIDVPAKSLNSSLEAPDRLEPTDGNSLPKASTDKPQSEIRMNFSDSQNNDDVESDDGSTVETNEDYQVQPLPEYQALKSESLVIHPPMIQPYNRNQHTFVIENRGLNPAREVNVEIKVPESARIIAALPINSVFSSHTAVFRFEEILSGEKVQVHLTAVDKNQDSISFVANVSAKSTYEFGAIAENGPQAELNNVSYNLSSKDSLAPHTEPRSATLIKNPYVDSSLSGGETRR